MRTLAICCLALLAFGSTARAQATATNQITQAQAIKLASKLTFSMREQDATTYLVQHGFKDGVSVGGSVGWSHFFSFSREGSLSLFIKRKKFGPEGERADGLLQAAYIQSNGINIVSINLTNAP
jgi:hypothetical protein